MVEVRALGFGFSKKVRVCQYSIAREEPRVRLLTQLLGLCGPACSPKLSVRHAFGGPSLTTA